MLRSTDHLTRQDPASRAALTGSTHPNRGTRVASRDDSGRRCNRFRSQHSLIDHVVQPAIGGTVRWDFLCGLHGLQRAAIAGIRRCPSSCRAACVVRYGSLTHMELKPWPADFARKKAGLGCPQCDQGRVDETEHGVRYFVGHVAGHLPWPPRRCTAKDDPRRARHVLDRGLSRRGGDRDRLSTCPSQLPDTR